MDRTFGEKTAYICLQRIAIDIQAAVQDIPCDKNSTSRDRSKLPVTDTKST